MFTHDLLCLPVNSASMALRHAQDACPNTNGHDPALIEMHLGSRASTLILQCLAIFDVVVIKTYSA
jgi:hypothetical protein